MASRYFGGHLPPTTAPVQRTRFANQVLSQVSRPIQAMFAQAECFTITELRGFLSNAEAMLNSKLVPANEQGIAIVLGINGTSGPSHTHGKISAMLVATSFTEDMTTGLVTAIDNPTITGTTNLDDMVYDTGSMYP